MPRLTAILLSGFLLLHPLCSLAYPYASAVTPSKWFINPSVSGTTFTYILNENATSVTLRVVNVQTSAVIRTFAAGAQARGIRSWLWNGRNDANAQAPAGRYTLQVTVASSGLSATSWMPIFDLSAPPPRVMNFFAARGVDVNRNPNGPAFGRIYVCENGGVTQQGRTTGDGLYVLNADGTDAVGQGDQPLATRAEWVTSLVSPFRVTVGPDDRVWMTDWSAEHAGVWATNADGANCAPALDPNNLDSFGVNYQHGRVAAVYVEGVGSATTLFTCDRDYGAVREMDGSVWRFAIGNSSLPVSTLPNIVINDATLGDLNRNLRSDLVRDRNGDWWMIQLRGGSASDVLPSLWKIRSDGGAVLWSSVPGYAPNSSLDPLKGAYCLAYDPPRNRLAIGTGSNSAAAITRIIILDISSGVPAMASRVEISLTGSNFDAAFDAVGNLYVLNTYSDAGSPGMQALRVWSPPGPSSNTTTMAGAVTVAYSGAPGDANRDGCVDDIDLTSVILDFASPGGVNGFTDLDNSGEVDDADLTLVILNYGSGC